MNSPTTNLLTSIQQMKNKLKNDKELLQDIKKDFNLIKPKEEDINYYPHYRDEVNIIHNFRSNAQHERDEKKQFAQRQKTVEDNYREPMDALKQAREAQSIDSTNRSKRRINELKKEHRE